MNGIERRRANRVRVNWTARMGRKGMGVVHARVRNISIGGVFVEASQQLPTRQPMLIELGAEHAGTTRKLLIEGEILRAIPPTADSAWGYGIRFLQLRDDDLFYLLAVVAELWAAGATAD